MSQLQSTVGSAEAKSRPGFRGDIQGLRALAVLMVLGFHVWEEQIPGGFVGVDVFFVISGFLITSHLVAHPPRRGRDLLEFWARRIRRLMPAALATLAVTLVGSRLLAPETQWLNTAKEAIAATLYVENWSLALTSVDYLAAENAPSPIQQFWSLSVEEQFYVFWPVLILVVISVAIRLRRDIHITLFVGLVGVVIMSFLYSLKVSYSEPAWAFFVTPTRVWELGVGAVLAVVLFILSHRDPSSSGGSSGAARTAIAWSGLVVILGSAFLINGSMTFPGWVALAPVLGTTAIIAAHCQPGGYSPSTILAWRPITAVGDSSYSIYLWHWPLIILVVPAITDDPGLGVQLVIVITAIGIGLLSKRYLEDSVRFGPHIPGLRDTYRYAALGMGAVIAMAGLQIAEVNSRQTSSTSAAQLPISTDPCFGAGAATQPPESCPPVSYEQLVPPVLEANADRSDAYTEQCWEYPPFPGVNQCTFGQPDARISVALLGNSHAGQWLPTLQQLAPENSLRVTTFLASECTSSDAALQWDAASKEEGCLRWASDVREAILAGDFDFVLVSNRNVHPAKGSQSVQESDEILTAGYRSYLEPFVDAGIPVVVVRDTPFPGFSIPDCLATNPQDMTQCAGSRDKWVPFDPAVDAVEQISSPDVQAVDLNDNLCGPEVCTAVLGGVVVYFDGSHMTDTFARTVAPALAQVLKDRGVLP
jgi:peptidoglycan/LPS O-acetylase OafA/YrhL